MPRLSVYMIRAALLCLGTGITFGSLMLWNKGELFEPTIWLLLAPHAELLIFGWIIQLAMGVAFWIMPRFTGENRYGNVKLAWAAFILFNIGIVMVSIGYLSDPVWLALGRVAEVTAIIAFVVHIYPRIKPLSVAKENRS